MIPIAILLSAALPTLSPSQQILFVGNSFTFGAFSPVQTWNGGSVSDLNHEGIGGVPALVKRFADESGMRLDVSLETSPGKSLEWHWDNRRALFDRRWDRVVLQEFSTLDAERPGNPGKLISYSGKLAQLFRARNPRVEVGLVATWSRPDLTWPAGKPWSGKPIAAMAEDIARGDAAARRATLAIRAVYPVGAAFTCAISAGIADPNPYDGLTPGTIDLWASDHYHASTAGYYLEALTIFAGIGGRDVRRLGRTESAAAELGIAPQLVGRLQQVAFEVSTGGCHSH